MNVLEIRKATVYRGTTRVFTNFSLEIGEGQSTVVLGPNGAGKSTLLKLLTREVYPVQQRGSYVKVLGHGLWNVWDIRSHLGIVSADLQEGYIEDADGYAVLLSGLYSSIGIWNHQQFNDGDRERAESLLNALGVWSCRKKTFSHMSTGEQRRLLLGRALISNPDVLVLDEPTNGLDLRACFQYLSIVEDLIGSGKTVVLVTHHVHEIPPSISRVILMKNGKVVKDGEKSRVITSRNLTYLFDIPVELVQLNRFFQAMPGTP